MMNPVMNMPPHHLPSPGQNATTGFSRDGPIPRGPPPGRRMSMAGPHGHNLSINTIDDELRNLRLDTDVDGRRRSSFDDRSSPMANERPTYEGWTLYKVNRQGEIPWTQATKSPMSISQGELATLSRKKKKMTLGEQLGAMNRPRRQHLDRLVEDRKRQDGDPRFEWSIVYVASGRNTVPKSFFSSDVQVTSMTIVLKRRLKPEFSLSPRVIQTERRSAPDIVDIGSSSDFDDRYERRHSFALDPRALAHSPPGPLTPDSFSDMSPGGPQRQHPPMPAQNPRVNQAGAFPPGPPPLPQGGFPPQHSGGPPSAQPPQRMPPEASPPFSGPPQHPPPQHAPQRPPPQHSPPYSGPPQHPPPQHAPQRPPPQNAPPHGGPPQHPPPQHAPQNPPPQHSPPHGGPPQHPPPQHSPPHGGPPQHLPGPSRFPQQPPQGPSGQPQNPPQHPRQHPPQHPSQHPPHHPSQHPSQQRPPQPHPQQHRPPPFDDVSGQGHAPPPHPSFKHNQPRNSQRPMKKAPRIINAAAAQSPRGLPEYSGFHDRESSIEDDDSLRFDNDEDSSATEEDLFPHDDLEFTKRGDVSRSHSQARGQHSRSFGRRDRPKVYVDVSNARRRREDPVYSREESDPRHPQEVFDVIPARTNRRSQLGRTMSLRPSYEDIDDRISPRFASQTHSRASSRHPVVKASTADNFYVRDLKMARSRRADEEILEYIANKKMQAELFDWETDLLYREKTAKRQRGGRLEVPRERSGRYWDRYDEDPIFFERESARPRFSRRSYS